ncbi:MAG: TetR/AcrR family transcriptional regulator, partial [Ignavibacteria bacterium]|nr:TetR/AcrR family transcriptional regulator [Ignavibacteria bacterium]
MTKNEIHEKRMKEYFIQATKELLKGEGLKVVSVRNVAEQAG